MKTKAEIVQRLLEEKKIDAEEACVLLMADNPQTVFVPYYPQPIYPHWPSWPQPIITLTNHTGGTYPSQPTFTSTN